MQRLHRQRRRPSRAPSRRSRLQRSGRRHRVRPAALHARQGRRRGARRRRQLPRRPESGSGRHRRRREGQRVRPRRRQRRHPGPRGPLPNAQGPEKPAGLPAHRDWTDHGSSRSPRSSASRTSPRTATGSETSRWARAGSPPERAWSAHRCPCRWPSGGRDRAGPEGQRAHREPVEEGSPRPAVPDARATCSPALSQGARERGALDGGSRRPARLLRRERPHPGDRRCPPPLHGAGAGSRAGPEWQSRQLSAAARFARDLADRLEGLATLRVRLARALRFGPLGVAPDRLAGAQKSLREKRLPQGVADVLLEAVFTPGELRDLEQRILAVPASAATGLKLSRALTDPGLAAAERETAEALRLLARSARWPHNAMRGRHAPAGEVAPGERRRRSADTIFLRSAHGRIAGFPGRRETADRSASRPPIRRMTGRPRAASPRETWRACARTVTGGARRF